MHFHPFTLFAVLNIRHPCLHVVCAVNKLRLFVGDTQRAVKNLAEDDVVTAIAREGGGGSAVDSHSANVDDLFSVHNFDVTVDLNLPAGNCILVDICLSYGVAC